MFNFHLIRETMSVYVVKHLSPSLSPLSPVIIFHPPFPFTFSVNFSTAFLTFPPVSLLSVFLPSLTLVSSFFSLSSPPSSYSHPPILSLSPTCSPSSALCLSLPLSSLLHQLFKDRMLHQLKRRVKTKQQKVFFFFFHKPVLYLTTLQAQRKRK